MRNTALDMSNWLNELNSKLENEKEESVSN